MVFCRECGTKLPDNGLFCPNCGTAVGNQNKSFSGMQKERIKENQSPVVSSDPQKEKPPLTWSNLLHLILTNTVKGLIKNIPMMLIIFFLSILIHTYLLVVYNEGFAPGTWVGSQLLATKGRVVSSTILWMLVSGFFFTAVLQIKAKGWNGFFRDISRIPGQMLEYFREAIGDGLHLFLAGMGLALLISGAMSGVTSLVLAAGAAAIFATPAGRVVAILIQSSWVTLMSAVNPRRTEVAASFGVVPAYISLIGSAVGFALASFLPLSTWIGLLLLVAVGVKIYTGNNSFGDKTFDILFFLFALTCMILRAKKVLADDGGWLEAGGTFSTWVRSPGAVKAVLHGIGPSIGAAVGPALTKAISAINLNNFVPQVPTSGDESQKGTEAPAGYKAPPEEEQGVPQEKPAKQYDDEGYDEEGYDRDGYDKNGFNRNGYDLEGYDREGYNREGYDRNGFNRQGYDRDGYDKNGFDRNGYDREGFNREGYNREGYDRNGFNREGYDRDGYDRNGFNRNGYDREGYNREGYDRFGFNRDGVNREGKTKEEVRAEMRRKLAELEKKSEEA
ncbi:MAG: zinc-ribbon domain-containing protein, partial [Deltaproteobacteria bacterium]|nr:zinc-ribbon domain-containing protein [Deltaproteobacteria bacterium]